MPRRRSSRLRLRLTLWHVSILGLVLVAYSAIVVLSLREWYEQDLDRRLQREVRAARAILDEGPPGALHWDPEDDDAERPFDHDLRVQAFDASGAELSGSPWPGEEEELKRLPPPTADGETTIVQEDGSWVRTSTSTVRMAGIPVRLRAARSMGSVRRRIAKLTTVMLWALPVALGVAGAGGWFLAGRALRPVGRMAEHARTITAQSLNERLPVQSTDELGQLAAVFNDTIGRLERSFEALKRFTGDASHELRTPLMALRQTGEMGLRRARSVEDCRDAIAGMLEEADRLAGLVDSLLSLARNDAGEARLQREAVDVRSVARETVEMLGVLAEEKGVRIEQRGDGPAIASIDPAVFRRAVVNVLHNAIKHAPPGSAIGVATSRQNGTVTLAISDAGPGIGPEHHHRVFERFFRVDKARTREEGGFGLGLSIARQIVEAHGGTIELDTAPGRGATFRLHLPA